MTRVLTPITPAEFAEILEKQKGRPRRGLCMANALGCINVARYWTDWNRDTGVDLRKSPRHRYHRSSRRPICAAHARLFAGFCGLTLPAPLIQEVTHARA